RDGGPTRLRPTREGLVGAARRDLVVELCGLRPLFLLLAGEPAPGECTVLEAGLETRRVRGGLERGEGLGRAAELQRALSHAAHGFATAGAPGTFRRLSPERCCVLEVVLGEYLLRLLQGGAARERVIREFLAQPSPRRVHVLGTIEPGRHGPGVVERLG